MKSVTQFVYVCSDQNQSVICRKMAKMDLETIDDNCTLHLKELKIKDYKHSAPRDESQLIDTIKDHGENINDEIMAKNRRTRNSLGDSEDVVKLLHTVSVTYYKQKLFKEAFLELDISQIHKSLSPKNNRETVFKAGEGSGRSGSFFFFSHDKRFIIKTMSTQELNLFLTYLPLYTGHFTTNESSLLARIFGVFTINSSHYNQVHVMLMENTAQLLRPDRLTYIFDLKGSLVDRKTKGVTKVSTTLKDVNFLLCCADRAKRGGKFVNLLEAQRKRLYRIIEKDVMFLKTLGFMDYSLLIVIESKDERQTLSV